MRHDGAGRTAARRQAPTPTGPRAAVYVLPLRATVPMDDELVGYLRGLAGLLEVVVADGSPSTVRAENARRLGSVVRQVAVPPPGPGENGKVLGVLAGMAASGAPLVVIADDDVRWDAATLREALARLDDADVVVPQNVLTAAAAAGADRQSRLGRRADARQRHLPWHARWDTARSLVNRAFGTDYPGTLLLRRAALPAGYDSRVLFENLELLRTVRAGGGRVLAAPDLLVRRLAPGSRKFVEQRVRQAYDSAAQPLRLVAELTALPALVLVRGRARLAVVTAAATASVLVAERGRRRAGGTRVYPWSAALWAPAWCAERAVCSWLALVQRVAGGARYGGTRIPVAAHSVAQLRRRHVGPAVHATGRAAVPAV